MTSNSSTGQPRRRRTGVLASVTALATALGVAISGAPAASAVPPVGVGLHENGAGSIVTTGEWDGQKSVADSGGSVSYASRAASASLTFTGTSVTWVSRTSPYSGIATVSIDGAVVATIDRYSAETEHARPVFTSEPLAEGVHTVTVASDGDANDAARGSNLTIDAFVVADAAAVAEFKAREADRGPVDPSAALSSDPVAAVGTEQVGADPVAASGTTGVGTHQNSAAGITYSGKWSTMNSRSDSGGSSRYLNSTGSASLSFTGTSVQWLSRLTPSAGIAEVYLDGKKVASVDRYSSTTHYQKTVFSRSGLSAGSHTIKIAWSGKANARSSGKNVVVDAIVVPDVTAPAAPAGLSTAKSGANIMLSWRAVVDAGLSGYRLYVRGASGPDRLIGQTGRGTTSFRSIGLPSNAALAYRVTALDAWGNESRTSSAASVRTGSTPAGGHRAGDCPTATATVSTVAGLQSAVAKAKPGTVIRLSSGTYPKQLKITAKGTAEKPIWICGSRSVVIDGGGLSVSSPIDVSGSSHLVVTGMVARNALKGVTVRASHHVTISDMLVEDIGYEGIHLRSNTTDSTVVGNVVRKTGRKDAFFGEGIYIGSSKNNWCALTKCSPDRSDRNAVLDNSVSQTGSDLIEAKEGTTGGLIAGNDLDGTGGMSRTESWMMLSGNDWVVTDNTARVSKQHGFRINGDMPGWGLRTLLVDNTGRVDAAGFGFKLWEPDGDGTSGTLVSCDNTITGARSGFSTVPCAD